MFNEQVKGLIAIFLILAVIPFILFTNRLLKKHEVPVHADQHNNSLIVAIADREKELGIYFPAKGTSVNELLASAGLGIRVKQDFHLKNGTKLIMDDGSASKIIPAKINNSQRLALKMPIDLNSATEDDLLLIPGIGLITAKKILKHRSMRGSFRQIEELMEIDGIKEKTFAKLKPFFYLQK